MGHRFGSGRPGRGARTGSFGVAPCGLLRKCSRPAQHTCSMRVLIVEDKVKMAGLLRRGLRGEGMTTDVAARGEDALWMAGATRYDAVVLDVMLPGIDGVETCRRLRADGVWTPGLMLTARGAVEDTAAGLDGGAGH